MNDTGKGKFSLILLLSACFLRKGTTFSPGFQNGVSKTQIQAKGYNREHRNVADLILSSTRGEVGDEEFGFSDDFDSDELLSELQSLISQATVAEAAGVPPKAIQEDGPTRKQKVVAPKKENAVQEDDDFFAQMLESLGEPSSVFNGSTPLDPGGHSRPNSTSRSEVDGVGDWGDGLEDLNDLLGGVDPLPPSPLSPSPGKGPKGGQAGVSRKTKAKGGALGDLSGGEGEDDPLLALASGGAEGSDEDFFAALSALIDEDRGGFDGTALPPPPPPPRRVVREPLPDFDFTAAAAAAAADRPSRGYYGDEDSDGGGDFYGSFSPRGGRGSRGGGRGRGAGRGRGRGRGGGGAAGAGTFQFDPTYPYSRRIYEARQRRDWKGAVDILEEAFQDGITPTTRMFTEVIGLCRQNRQAQVALEVYRRSEAEGVPADTYMFNAVVAAAGQCPDLGGRDVLALFRDFQERRGVMADTYCYSSLLSAVCTDGDPATAKALVEQVLSQLEEALGGTLLGSDATKLSLSDGTSDNEGQQRATQSPGLGLYSAVIQALLKVDETERAMAYFDQLRAEGVALDERLYTSSMRVLSQKGRYQEAFALWQDMLMENVEPTFKTYNNLLITCQLAGDWQMALDLLKDAQRRGVDDPHLVSLAVSVLMDQGQQEKAMELVEGEGQGRGIRGNTKIFTGLMAEHAKNDNFDGVMEVKRRLGELGLPLDAAGYGALVQVCAKRRQNAQVLKYYKQMLKENVVPNTMTFNQIMKIYSTQSDGDQKALALLDEMESKDVTPDQVTFNLLIQATSQKRGDSDAQMPLILYRRMKKTLVSPNLFVFNSLISASSKTGSLALAELFLGELRAAGLRPDLFTYASLIAAATNAPGGGEPQAALRFYEDMETEGVEADEITLFQMVRALALGGDAARARAFLAKLEAHPRAGPQSVATGHRYLAVGMALDGASTEEALEVWAGAADRGAEAESEDYAFALRAAAEHGLYELASELLSELRNDGLESGPSYYEMVARACARGGGAELALAWLEEMGDEGFYVTTALVDEVAAGCREAGDWESAAALLDLVETLRDDGLIREEHAGAPAAWLADALVTCADARVYAPGMEIVQHVESNGVALTTQGYNAILRLLLLPGQQQQQS